MPVNVTIDLPAEVLENLRRESADLEMEVREAFLLELFRQGRLSHFELAQALGLDRFETDTFLKRHNIFEGSLTMEDLEADRLTLERVMGKAS
jgi:predicted HTH domain antitoxin